MSASSTTHYPTFDVLKEQTAWDDYSRRVVLKRLEQQAQPTFLQARELKTLQAVCEHLLYESRRKVIDFVVAHVDKQLGSPIGESDRKQTVPPQAVLVQRGLAALNAAAALAAGSTFEDSPTAIQVETLKALQKGSAILPPGFEDVPQKQLFTKLLRLAVDALASHPAIWNEIGYPGPAYPRGYYRIERGIHDPWEAIASRSSNQGGGHDD